MQRHAFPHLTSLDVEQKRRIWADGAQPTPAKDARSRDLDLMESVRSSPHWDNQGDPKGPVEAKDVLIEPPVEARTASIISTRCGIRRLAAANLHPYRIKQLPCLSAEG